MMCDLTDDEIHHHVVTLLPWARVSVERPDGNCTAVVLVAEPTPYSLLAKLMEDLRPDEIEVDPVVLTNSARAELFLRLRVSWLGEPCDIPLPDAQEEPTLDGHEDRVPERRPD